MPVVVVFKVVNSNWTLSNMKGTSNKMDEWIPPLARRYLVRPHLVTLSKELGKPLIANTISSCCWLYSKFHVGLL